MHLLILNLTTSQATLRMRVWRTLKQSGAAVLRDGVYLLPDVRQGYDTFLSTCQAIRAEGGTGYVFTIEAAEEEALRPLFDRREKYDALLQDLQALQGTLSNDELAAQLKQLRKIQRDYRRIEAIDFFPGAAREQAAERLATIEQVINQRLSPNEPQSVAGELSLLDRGAFRGRLWATRRRRGSIVWPAPGLSGALLTTRRGSCGWPRPRPVRRRRSVLILTARHSAMSARW